MNGEAQGLPAPPSQLAAIMTGTSAAVPSAVLASTTSAQTADSLPQFASSSTNPIVPNLLTNNSTAATTTTTTTTTTSQEFTEMLDVGGLAPRNATCALCDCHDYLHRTDLPAYLTSPCYHCRESLARDAKITPEDLFDLHLQVGLFATFIWTVFVMGKAVVSVLNCGVIFR